MIDMNKKYEFARDLFFNERYRKMRENIVFYCKGKFKI